MKSTNTIFLITLIIVFIHLNIHAQGFEIEGSLKIADGTQAAGHVLTSDANGNAQWASPSLLSSPTSGDMLYWDGSAWQAVAAGTQGQQLTFCDNKPQWGSCTVSNNQSLTTTVHQISQTWSQQTNYNRPVHINVPAGNGPFPVVILLHGNGGNGAGMLNYITDNVIKVAPNGYVNSWNIKSESSKAPDVDFIADIITYVKTFNNVDPNNISILGISNGSGMVNKLLVELPAATFQNAVSIVSPMTDSLYHDGAFYYDPTGGNAYNTTIVPPTDRRILVVSGTNDALIPYNGGIGVLGYSFIAAQTSAYIWAQHKGYMGTQIADTSGVAHPSNANLIKYEYLSGDVIHYKLIGGTHGTGGDTQVKEVISDFLGY